MSREYELVVVGNGAAGDGIARTAARAGRRVAVVEARRLGGECLNDGCIPSKALISLAGGVVGEPPPWNEVTARIAAVQTDIRGPAPDGGLAADGIDLVRGEAAFRSPTELRVGDQTLRTEAAVLATGTAPALPPVAGLAEAGPLTNRSVFQMASLPRRLAVLGAGPIGLELGQALSRLGSEVTIFEALDRVLPGEEPEVSQELARLLRAEGIEIITGSRVEGVERAGEEVRVKLAGEEFRFDEILVAAGRSPQIPAGLADLGLERDRRGFVAVGDCGRTNLPGLWAAGDVTGRFQFTHYASHQGDHVVRNILEGRCDPIPEVVVPWAVFTDPEVGHVGFTEEEAAAGGRRVRTAILNVAEVDWFRTSGRTDGFVKVVAEEGSGLLLGVHFLCALGGALAGEATLALQHGLTAAQVANTVHAYPTASELFRWACSEVAPAA